MKKWKMKTKLTKKNLRIKEEVPEGGVVGVSEKVVAVELDGLEHIIPRLERLGGGGTRCQGQENKEYIVPHFGERRFHDFVMA